MGNRGFSSITNMINTKPLVIYSKTYCPHCTMAKASLANYAPAIIEVDTVQNATEITDDLLKETGQRTFPNIFVNGEHIGGNDDLQEALKEGKIDEMLGKP